MREFSVDDLVDRIRNALRMSADEERFQIGFNAENYIRLMWRIVAEGDGRWRDSVHQHLMDLGADVDLVNRVESEILGRQHHVSGHGSAVMVARDRQTVTFPQQRGRTMTVLPVQDRPAAPNVLDEITHSGYQLVMAGVSDNTRKIYSQMLSQFDVWCSRHGRPTTRESPTTPSMIINYLADLFETPVGRTGIPTSPSTVNVILSAIRFHHRHMQDVDPTWTVPQSAHLTRAYFGYCLKWAKAGYRRKQAIPTTWDDLNAYDMELDRTNDIQLRDMTMILTSWWMCARASDIAAVSITDTDIKWSDDAVQLYLPWSKTDRRGNGVWVTIPRYDAHPRLCAYRALRAWTSHLHDLGYHRGALFPQSVGTRSARIDPQMRRLSPEAVSCITQRIAKRIGIGPRSGHSHRRGAATAASRAGATLQQIMKMGRWVSADSAAKYIDDLSYEHPLIG